MTEITEEVQSFLDSLTEQRKKLAFQYKYGKRYMEDIPKLLTALRESRAEVERMRTDVEMLKFLLSQFQSHSLQMNNQHSWRFRSGSWPMSHAKGANAREAVQHAMEEQERERMDTNTSTKS